MNALVLRGVRVWDGEAQVVSPDPVSVRVESGRIAAIGPEPGLERGARPIDLAGCVALPGLIDAHVHLDLDPALASPAEQAAVPRAERVRRLEQRARAMLRAGITTARDLGGGDWLELDLRDRIASGVVRGPRLLCAGQPVTRRGGHCHFWGGEAEGGAEQLEVIERQLGRGADWIKVMATGGVFTKGTRPSEAQFGAEELREMVAAAARAGRPIAAHCHGSVGIRHAVAAGVRSIEHCSFAGAEGFGSDLDPRLVAALARSQSWVSPTVNVGWGRRARGEDGAPSDFFARMSKVLRALHAAGVGIVASTDAGIPGVEHHRLAAGLAALADYAGLSPREVLRSATARSADALGLGPVCGRLQAGLAADVLVVEGDPLQDLGCLERPRLVLARGEPVAEPG